jgi:hypothetical protein
MSSPGIRGEESECGAEFITGKNSLTVARAKGSIAERAPVRLLPNE